MNKLSITIVVIVVAVLALGTASSAYAQTPAQTPGTGLGRMGGRGGMGGGNVAAGEGILHEYLLQAFAQKLNLSAASLEGRMANGETLAQIAAAQGLTAEQFRTLMFEARTQAVDQAVKDGKLTQQQADWMKQHGAGQMAASQPGSGRGMRGAGQGRYTNPDCPYTTQTNP